MKISDRIIHQIVMQISRLIHQNINFIGPDGIIIDSTDKNRIGTVHGGAKRIIREGLTDLIIESSDEYEGAVNGINLPIVFMDEIVGVIGITGSSRVVASYGQIVKGMTEIMLQENYLREQETIVQKAHDRFLDEWVFGSFDINDPAEFQRRAESFNIDTDAVRRVAIINIHMENRTLDDEEMTEISRWIRGYLNGSNGIKAEVFRTMTRMICLFEATDHALLEEKLIEASEYLEGRFGCTVSIGLNSDKDFKNVRDAYDKADRALLQARKGTSRLVVYDGLDTTKFFTQIPEKEMEEYIRLLLGDSLMPELDEIMAFLKCYVECNGSVQETARRLSMHKNTVQYKLRRLADLTGYDPRELKNLNSYMLAMQLYDYMNS